MSRVYQSTVAVLVTVMTDVPSTASVHRFDVPHGALVFMPTDRFPLTLAPAAGELNVAVKPPVDVLRLNIAVTVVAAPTATRHVPVPLHPPPLQPANVEPLAAAAVSVAIVPEA